MQAKRKHNFHNNITRLVISFKNCLSKIHGQDLVLKVYWRLNITHYFWLILCSLPAVFITKETNFIFILVESCPTPPLKPAQVHQGLIKLVLSFEHVGRAGPTSVQVWWQAWPSKTSNVLLRFVFFDDASTVLSSWRTIFWPSGEKGLNIRFQNVILKLLKI